MANTYTQIHIQFVFSVKYRDGLIQSSFKAELYKYISGILKPHNHKLLAINGMPDHIHIFIGMRPTQSISDLMQDIKGNSSKWINEKKFLKVKFEWQEGFGAFSYSKSHVNKVIDYIKNQEVHHKKETFRDEYLKFLKAFEIDYDERYIFKDLI
ncbi:MAG: IS200/IS605 family transposase [Flavobacterium sp.]|nr:IS200/IS605 family transposase [Flavobacterium sp.]